MNIVANNVCMEREEVTPSMPAIPLASDTQDAEANLSQHNAGPPSMFWQLIV